VISSIHDDHGGVAPSSQLDSLKSVDVDMEDTDSEDGHPDRFVGDIDEIRACKPDHVKDDWQAGKMGFRWRDRPVYAEQKYSHGPTALNPITNPTRYKTVLSSGVGITRKRK
jgi:hypothetical protein